MPVVESTSTFAGSGAVTNTVPYPAGLQAGDVVITVVQIQDASTGTPSIVGATTLAENTSRPRSHAFAYVADGNEGATFDVVMSTARRIAVACYRVSGVDPARIAAAAFALDVNDPPELTAPWGSAANLWIAALGHWDEERANAAPADYSGLLLISSAAAASVALAHRTLTAATENPGAFGVSAAPVSPRSLTIVLGPSAGPVPAGTTTVGTITPATTTAQIEYSYDAADEDSFEYRLDGGTWAAIGASPATITGLTADTTYAIEARAINANGAGTASAAVQFTTLADLGGTVTVTEPLANNTGTLLTSESGVIASVLRASDMASVYEITGLTTNGSGVLDAIQSPAITAGQSYHVAIQLADGGVGITGPITAT